MTLNLCNTTSQKYAHRTIRVIQLFRCYRGFFYIFLSKSTVASKQLDANTCNAASQPEECQNFCPVRSLISSGDTAVSCQTDICRSSRAGCYWQRKPLRCCGTEVCLRRERDIPTCVVDGKTYKRGERFTTLAEPNKTCYCGQEDTDGKVFTCLNRKPSWCKNTIVAVKKNRENCAPIYAPGRSPRIAHCLRLRGTTSSNVSRIARSYHSICLQGLPFLNMCCKGK